MIDEEPTKRSNRRSRSERTKRRVRYSTNTNLCEVDQNPSLYCTFLPSSSDSGHYSLEFNNFDKVQCPKNLETLSNATQSVNKATKDHLYKILVIGDLGTGKTSIIKRYVHRFFTQHYRATIGVDFALKALTWDDHTVIRLQLWDIAGQERYGNMTRVYYKEAVGAFIVFDVTRRSTLESVANWKSDLDSKVQLPDGSSIPCVLLANKCDQAKEGFVTDSIKMDKYCTQNGFTAWFETSARDNINIDEAAKALVEKILWYDSLLDSETKKQGDQFALTRDTNESINSGSNKSCSC